MHILGLPLFILTTVSIPLWVPACLCILPTYLPLKVISATATCCLHRVPACWVMGCLLECSHAFSHHSHLSACLMGGCLGGTPHQL